ncbi:MAG TPA: hypothetical protein VL261_09775 [Nitrospira sp.]|jgi:hypothetical protein|nr:hypothetical protein [Nitrospira sp.]
MDKKKTPVVLFAYDRPEHLSETIRALRANKEALDTDLIVYSDASAAGVASERVGQVRKILRAIDGFRSVTITERETNFGLSRSIIDGVTSLCADYGRVIVLEDDMIVSRHFLAFMNEALEMYENCENVASIHGYVYPVGSSLPDTFFLRGADCWGWATWARAWKHFNPDGRQLLEELERRKLVPVFDFNKTFGFTYMLRAQIDGKVDSWAVRWYASAFLRNMYTLYPGRPLVRNIGIDGSGVHCAQSEKFTTTLSNSPINVVRIEVMDNDIARKAFEQYFTSIKPNVISRAADKLLQFLTVPRK